MFLRSGRAVIAPSRFVAPAMAQDESALIQGHQQMREMARDALAHPSEIIKAFFAGGGDRLSGTSGFKGPR